jgi:pimeloyl-ACP methyl ester carboxylesterase
MHIRDYISLAAPLILLLDACASTVIQPMPNSQPPTASAAASATGQPAEVAQALSGTETPAAFRTRVDVGGHELEILCMGAGTPVVVLDNGLGISYGSWVEILMPVSQFTRVCAYDRPRLSAGEPPVQPRTSQEMANDLHTLLARVGITGPYVLVGHSIAGFNVRLFATQHPEEVVGVVLVDSSHPDQAVRFAAALPPAAPDEPASVKLFRQEAIGTADDPWANPEAMDVAASAAQVRDAGALGDLPLVVLSQSSDSNPIGLPAEVKTTVNQVWQELQTELASLSTNSTHIVASKAGHFIQEDEPELVIEAIRQLVETARSQR